MEVSKFNGRTGVLRKEKSRNGVGLVREQEGFRKCKWEVNVRKSPGTVPRLTPQGGYSSIMDRQ